MVGEEARLYAALAVQSDQAQCTVSFLHSVLRSQDDVTGWRRVG
jgi:hypothetical protein